jgi:hypothetical protein
MEMTDAEIIQHIGKLQNDLASAVNEMNSLFGELKGFAPAPKPSFTSIDEERSHVFRFMFNLQDSGITNMINSDSFLQKRFGFTKAKAEQYVFEYIDNYTKLRSEYSEVKKAEGPRVIKLKKSNAMAIWNSFLQIVKAEMESGGVLVKYEDVRKKAIEMKESDPESYKVFSDNWTPN